MCLGICAVRRHKFSDDVCRPWGGERALCAECGAVQRVVQFNGDMRCENCVPQSKTRDEKLQKAPTYRRWLRDESKRTV